MSVASSTAADRERKQPAGLGSQSRRWLLTGGMAFVAYVLTVHYIRWGQVLFQSLGFGVTAWRIQTPVLLFLLGGTWYCVTRPPKYAPMWAVVIAWASRVTMAVALGYNAYRIIGVTLVQPAPSAATEAYFISQLFNALATFFGWLWLAVFACRMGSRASAMICVTLVAGSLLMGRSPLYSLGWISPTSLQVPSISADLPIVGPIWNTSWTLNPYHMIFVPLASLAMFAFGVALLIIGMKRKNTN